MSRRWQMSSTSSTGGKCGAVYLGGITRDGLADLVSTGRKPKGKIPVIFGTRSLAGSAAMKMRRGLAASVQMSLGSVVGGHAGLSIGDPWPDPAG
jgi:hypothetical protein